MPVAILFVLLLAGGSSDCSSLQLHVETYVTPNAPVDTLRQVVLLPLVNRSDDAGAAIALGAMLAKNLVAQAHLMIRDCPPGLPVDAEHLDREQAAELARALGVDGVVTGIVFAYGYVTEPGSPPRPTALVDLRLFGAKNADLLWAARASATDAPGMASRGASLTTIADALTGQLAADLIKRQ
jgi:hypothetical protein